MNNKIVIDFDFNIIKISYIKNKEQKINLLSYPLFIEESKEEGILYNNKIYIIGENSNNFVKLNNEKSLKLLPLFLYDALKNKLEFSEISSLTILLSFDLKNYSSIIKEVFSKFNIENNLYSFDVKFNFKIISGLNYIKNYINNEPDNYLLINFNYINIDCIQVQNKKLIKENSKVFDKGFKIFIEALSKSLNNKYNENELIEIYYKNYTIFNLSDNEIKEIEIIIKNLKINFSKSILNFILKQYNNTGKIIISGDYSDIFDNEKVLILEESKFLNVIGEIL